MLLYVLLIAEAHAYAMLRVKPLSNHAIKTTRYINTRSFSGNMPSDMDRLYNDIAKIGNQRCSDAYTKSTCHNDMCCKNAYLPSGGVNTKIRDDFFEKLNNPIEFVEELERNTNELRILDGYIKWRLLNSQEKNNWAKYQKAFGLITHKSMCILNQIRMLYQDAPPSWDERTYHWLGSMNVSEAILNGLITINQYAANLTQEEMHTILMEEIQENTAYAKNVESKEQMQQTKLNKKPNNIE